MTSRKAIYLDYAATTPLDPEVFKKMKPYFSDDFSNPSSIHKTGAIAKEAVEKARKQVADVLKCCLDEVVFTSSGTESDNLALKGLSEARGYKGHIITSAIEHRAVLDTAKYLESRGVGVTYVLPDRYGRVNPKDVISAIRRDTFLVSIMLANNEIGTIEPVPEIGSIVQRKGIIMHTDAVQAPGLLSIDVRRLHLDMMSLSGHKFYGPKGAGILFLRRGIQIVPQLSGGGQESGLRSSTENVPAIVGLAKALHLSEIRREKEARRLSELRDWLIGALPRAVQNSKLTGHPSERLPNNASFCFKGIEGELLVMRLSELGFETSSGSACSSGSSASSRVLSACGIDKDSGLGALRVTIGAMTTKKDLEKFVGALSRILNRRNPAFS